MNGLQKLTVVTFMVVVIIGGCLLYQSYNANLQEKLNHQSKYPYSCVVSDKLWDACATDTYTEYWSVASNRTCAYVYYAVRDWGNHHFYIIDSQGIIHYKAYGYDSNEVYHEGSNYFECPRGES